MKSSQLWRSAVVGVLAWLGVSLSSPADATYYSIASVVETGSTNIVSVPFPYLQQANVYVFVNGVQTSAYSWLTSSTIQMTASAASLAGSTITVQRVTSVAATAVTFQAGGLDPNDLNTQSLQLLYAQQEIADEWAQLGVSELTGGYLSREGSTTVLATVSGTLVPGHCPQIGPLLDIIDGGACSIGGGGGSVSSGTTGQLAQYTSNGTTLGPATGSGTGSVMFNNGATSTNEALTTPTITSPIISNPTINGGTLSGTLSGGSYSGTASGTLTGTLTGTVGSSATGTTQTLGDSSNKIATDAFVAAAVASVATPPPPFEITGGLPTAMSGTNTTAAITISAVTAADQTGAAYIGWTGTKSWAVSNGNAINGYAGGTTLPNSSTIHMYACSGGSGSGTYGSLTAPGTFVAANCPTGYTSYARRIFSFTTSSAGAPNPFTADEIAGGSYVAYLSTPTLDVNGATASTASRTLYTMSVPQGLKMQWQGRLNQTGALDANYTSPDEPDVAPSTTAAPLVDTVTYSMSLGRMIMTNGSGQIGVRGVNAGTIYLSTLGWIDFRRS